MTESWYDVLSKVMRIWSKGTLKGENKSLDISDNADIEDYYVFLYDEEDHTNN
jgi:hypothetical protein